MENKAAKTAFGPIFQVALEQLLPEDQRILQDDITYQFLPPYLKRIVSLCRIAIFRNTLYHLITLGGPGIPGGILCRKRFITDRLVEALNAGMHTVVDLGCGFDTLVYRVPGLASCQVFEVDLPQVIQAKRILLERLFGRVPAYVKLVSMDFDAQNLEQVLLQAGYASDKPAFFIWEGVSQYISEAAVHRMFDFFRHVPMGSQLVFTYIRKDFIDGKQLYGQKFLYRQTRVVKQLWRFGLQPEAVESFLQQYGWKMLDHAGSAEYQHRYLAPINRALPVMEIERAVQAEKNA